MNLENFENPLNEKLYIVDIQPLLNEPSNSIYKSVFSYQRLRIRNKMGLNLEEVPWSSTKAAFTQTDIDRENYVLKGADSSVLFSFRATNIERRVVRNYPIFSDILVGLANGTKVLFVIFALGYLFFYSQYQFDKYLLSKMVATSDQTLPKKFQLEEDFSKLFSIIESHDNKEDEIEKASKKLTDLEKQKLSILHDLATILDNNQDLAYSVSRGLVESGINASFMPNHYTKLLPLAVLNNRVEEFQRKQREEEENELRQKNTQNMLSSLLSKIKNDESLKKPTYKEIYQKLASSSDNDEIHRIVNQFIFKWFPKETEEEVEQKSDEESALIVQK